MSLFSNPIFPNSNIHPFEVTSQYDVSYNCIAWAYEDPTQWYWPDKENHWYWPEIIPRKERIDCFIALFDSICYRKCKNGDKEKGFTKIAIFVDQTGVPTHAARQLPNGYWTSKLGKGIDVKHTIFGIDGGIYGSVAVYMKRPTSPFLLNIISKINKPFLKLRIKHLTR